jgi:hypothetical protein
MRKLMAVVALLCGVASVCAAEPMRDKKPVLFMHDIMINSPPETPFGTAMGAFIGTSALVTYPLSGARLCSYGFDKPANLVFGGGDDDMMWVSLGGKPIVYIPNSVTFTLGDKAERYAIHEPLSNNEGVVYGAVVVPSSSDNSGETYTDSAEEVDSAKVGDVQVAIFRDRVFWPCDVTETGTPPASSP